MTDALLAEFSSWRPCKNFQFFSFLNTPILTQFSLFQIVPTIITIARLSQGSDEDIKVKSKESDEKAREH